MTALADRTLVEAADAVRSGETTAVALLDACLARLDAVNPQINAVIWTRADDARAAAEAADKAVAEGKRTGLLHGVPLAHKDMYYQAGRPCTCGSAIRRDFVPDYSATVIERMAAAGAVCFAGLNMAEFAQNPTGHNRAFGDCHNPWKPPYITGGSSSGSGAAVAAGITFGSLGSDTGGSIRLPASACGVTGIKGTQTRVSRYGVMPLSFSADNVGPLARTARDCARLLRVIAGHDPRDPTSSAEPVPDYDAALNGDIRGQRILVPTNVLVPGADAPVLAAFEAGAGGAGGARRENHPPPAAADGCGVGLWSGAVAGRGGDDPRPVDARAGGGLCGASLRPAVCRLRDPGDVLCGGAEPARAGAEGVRPRGFRRGRSDRHADHPDLPAHARGHRHRPRGRRAPSIASLRCRSTPGRSTISGCRRPASHAASIPTDCRSACNWPGAPFAEARLLRVADAYQRDTNWHHVRPPMVRGLGAA